MISSMSSNDTSLVDVTGLCDPKDVRGVISQYPYWMQMYVPETLTIPAQKPDMESINSVNISVNIIRSRVIKTPVSNKDASGNFIPNLEGKILTGRKVIIQGELCQKVEYTACNEEQSIHSAHFYVPFSAYIIVPQNVTFTYNGITETIDSLDLDYQINSCIEDLSVRALDDRTLLKQVTLLLYAVPTQSC